MCKFFNSNLCDFEIKSSAIQTIIFLRNTLKYVKILDIKGNEKDGMRSCIKFSDMTIESAIFKDISDVYFDISTVSIHDTDFYNVDFTGCDCRKITCKNVRFKHCYYIEAGQRLPITREYFYDDTFDDARFED